MAIINGYCGVCSHEGVCEWVDKLDKIDGTNKKPGVLNITVDSCEAFDKREASEDDED